MRVNGEAFFLINGWMNYLSLLIASRMGHIRLKAGKAVLSAAVGAFYSVIAWTGKPFLSSFPMVILSALFMSALSFGSSAVKAVPLMLASGWLLSGMSNFALKKGAGSWAVIILCSGAVLVICLCMTGYGKAIGRLEIAAGGKQAAMLSLADNGNLLREKITGLPVIIAPEKEIGPLLPPGTDIHDLSTLPEGWRLIGIRTAAGTRTLMCFHPDQIILRQGMKARKIDAAVAISDFEEHRALLPAGLCAER